jgi:hypothetical protein
MEPQTPIDVQHILERKRNRAEYDKQRKLKRKLELEMQTAIDEEYVLEKKRNTCHTVQNITDTHNIVPCEIYTSCV